LSGYRNASVTAAPAVRTTVMPVLLLISVILVYTANRAAHDGQNRGWLVAVAMAGVLVARGLYLRRPITVTHLAAAVLMLALSDLGYRLHHPAVGFVLLAASGVALVAPRSSVAQPELRYRVGALVARTTGDPLAPFALHSAKSYFVAEDGSAALAYRTRFGVAVVSGDPIGDRASHRALMSSFSEFAQSQGWRIGVLGAGPDAVQAWQELPLRWGSRLRAIAIGRDVMIDVDSFSLEGRRFRNLRQAVSRTRNFGVTTEMLDEGDVAADSGLRAELLSIVDEWHAGRQTRGFSMILDHLLDGRHPGMLVVLARDSSGRVAGFQRYGRSGGGTELSLDVPWRRHDAPNGLDERMIVDLVDYGREHGVKSLSLAFAAFPELFDETGRTLSRQICYRLVHLLDPMIRLESLYRFLRKFRALAGERYVLLSWLQVVPVALAMLTLEFVPHRERP
jgi:lysylphosphatidylglycerol synthetase-like protein (DUF2156 family)